MTEARALPGEAVLHNGKLPKLGRHKVVYVFAIADGPKYVMSSDGPIFGPYKVEVTDFGDRARAIITGRSMNHHGMRSFTYVLYGEEYLNADKRRAPEWLASLIREAGYTGTMVSAPTADSAAR